MVFNVTILILLLYVGALFFIIYHLIFILMSFSFWLYMYVECCVLFLYFSLSKDILWLLNLSLNVFLWLLCRFFRLCWCFFLFFTVAYYIIFMLDIYYYVNSCLCFNICIFVVILLMWFVVIVIVFVQYFLLCLFNIFSMLFM